MFRYICPDNIFIEPVQNTKVILNIDRVDFSSQKQSNLFIIFTNKSYICYSFQVAFILIYFSLIFSY